MRLVKQEMQVGTRLVVTRYRQMATSRLVHCSNSCIIFMEVCNLTSAHHRRISHHSQAFRTFAVDVFALDLDVSAYGLVIVSWITYHLPTNFQLTAGLSDTLFFIASIIAAGSNLIANSLSQAHWSEQDDGVQCALPSLLQVPMSVSP